MTWEGSGVGRAMVTKVQVLLRQLLSQVIFWWAGVSWVFSALVVNPGAFRIPYKLDTHSEHKFPEKLRLNIEYQWDRWARFMQDVIWDDMSHVSHLRTFMWGPQDNPVPTYWDGPWAGSPLAENLAWHLCCLWSYIYLLMVFLILHLCLRVVADFDHKVTLTGLVAHSWGWLDLEVFQKKNSRLLPS